MEIIFSFYRTIICFVKQLVYVLVEGCEEKCVFCMDTVKK